jgi:hypothetical protein
MLVSKKKVSTNMTVPITELSPKKRGPPFGAKNRLGKYMYDLEAEAAALDAWSKKDDSFHFSEFANERNVYRERIYEWIANSEIFEESYRLAKCRIACRLRKKLHDKENPYNYGLFMREIGFYDSFLHEYEREEKIFDSKLRKDEAKPSNINININDPTNRSTP